MNLICSSVSSIYNLPPPSIAENNPVDLKWIKTQQSIGTKLVTKAAWYHKWSFSKIIDNQTIVCHALPNKDCLTQWKIAITKEMVTPYSILTNSGCKRSHMTIQARCYHLDIQKRVDNFHCNYCQCVKIPCKEMGLLPEYDLTNMPWYEVAVDLVGPWSAKTEHFNENFMHWHVLIPQLT